MSSNGTRVSFAEKLYTLLHEGDASTTIISFIREGRCFKVHDVPRFESELLPKYYRHHNYESFQRQLNMYGFKRLKGKRDGGAYFHPMLRRNRKDLVPYIGKDILKDLARLEQLTARDSKIAELESEFALQTNQPVNNAVEVTVKNDSVYGQVAEPSSATSDEGVCSEESLEHCDDFEFLLNL